MTDPHSGEPLNEHPAAEELAAYLSGTLPPGSCAAVEEHLAECRECRLQVTSARRLLRQHRSPNRRLWLVPAAAAAILAVAVVVRSPVRAPVSAEPLRGDSSVPGAETPTRIGVVAPAEGDTVGPAAVVFVWRGQVGKPLYRLTLTTGSGREVWAAETGDTTLALPSSVSLERGRPYFWVVDALGGDGRSLTTRNHRFLTRP